MSRGRAGGRGSPFKWAAALLLCAGAGWTAEYHLEPSGSWIKFEHKARFGSGTGEFHRFAVTADVDEAALEKSKVEAVIDVSSIDTGIKKRDRHLLTADFFDAEKYPAATLTVGTVTAAAGGQYEAAATLTLHGVTQALTLPATAVKGEGALLLQGETVISRKAFGIAYQSRLNPIRDEVKVLYRLELRKATP